MYGIVTKKVPTVPKIHQETQHFTTKQQNL